jgi:hypothetical protein
MTALPSRAAAELQLSGDERQSGADWVDHCHEHNLVRGPDEIDAALGASEG